MQSNGQNAGRVAPVLAPPEADRRVGLLQGEDRYKVVANGQRAKLLRRAAGGIQAADQRAHAGAVDAVNRNAVLLQPLQHANVGKAERAAAFKRNTHYRPSR